MRTILTVLLLGLMLTGAIAQRPRTIEPDPAATSKVSAPPTAPTTVKAKYEGGVFGYTKTMEGTLTFDDANNRLLFKDKQPPKEISIPYAAITSAFADTQKRQPAAATVAGQVQDDSGKAVAGATVSAVGGEAGETSATGSFLLKTNAAAGQVVRLHAEKRGYAAVDQDHLAGREPVTIVLRAERPRRTR